MNLAPIVLFVYNRPQHTLRTLEALALNHLAKESILYIFADGPKDSANVEILANLAKTREIIKSKEWCKKTIIVEAEINKGLARSIIDGVSKIVNEYGKIIVLEDDLVVSPYFLRYMNDALNTYSEDTSVACISGYVYPTRKKMPETFFIKGSDCWGWSTWKRAWDIFESDSTKLMKELQSRSLTSKFDFDNTYPYTLMLQEHITGINNSWAIRWYASTFLKNKYCLHPGTSLVQNIGIDGSGTHSGDSGKWDVTIAEKAVNVKKIKVEQNMFAYEQFKSYFKTLRGSLLSRINSFVKNRIINN